MTCVCGNDGDPICISCGMVRRWFVLDILHSLRQIQCNQKFALLAIPLYVKVELDATSVKQFLFKQELPKSIFIVPAPGVTRKRADRTEDTASWIDDLSRLLRGACGLRYVSGFSSALLVVVHSEGHQLHNVSDVGRAGLCNLVSKKVR